MATNDWKRIGDLFREALELPPGERGAFLDRACEGNDSLRAEVESLLAADDESGDFIGDAVRNAAMSGEIKAGHATPDRIGPFEIVEELGRGGMGIVYLAQRTDRPYQHKVALKLMHWSLENTEHVRRFEVERNILANLNHPGIAKLVDGGELADGRPWIAMEWVDGAPIGHWCDERRLSIPDRARLFRKVCDAVGFAHRNLVVHGDLKPSNILVAADGAVKLIDFGMAKLLEVSGGMEAITRVGFRPLTPEYASPEQVRGETLGTGTDVYSLGVVFYELLTGKRPYRIESSSLGEIERIVCGEDPVRPSEAVLTTNEDGGLPAARATVRRSTPERLRRRLAGDLDNIVLKAMQKDPARRYASTDGFSEDLGHYVQGRPVSARPDTWKYRAGKFIGRNRTAVAAALVVAASLLASAFISLHFAAQASNQRDLAELRFEEVRSLAMTFLEDVDHAIVNDGRIAAREKIVATGLEYLDRLREQGGEDVSLRMDLARGYLKVADIQANWLGANLGRVTEAHESAGKGAALAERLFEEIPDDPEIRILHIHAEDLIAVLSHHEMDLAATDARLARVLALREELDADGFDSLRRPRAYEIVGHRAKTQEWQGLYENAATHIQEVIERIDALLVAAPEDVSLRKDRLNTEIELAQVYQRAGEFEQACAILEPIRDRLLGGETETHGLFALAWTHQSLGRVYDAIDRDVEARQELEAALAGFQSLAEEDPSNIGAQRSVSVVHHWLGRLSTDERKFEQALNHMNEMLAIRRAIAAIDTTSVSFVRDVAVGVDMKGTALRHLGRTEEALAHHYEANEIFTRLADNAPGNVDALRSVSVSWYFLGMLLADLGDEADAAGRRAEARQKWNEAKRAFSDALAIMISLRDEGQLPPGDADVVDMLQAEIDRSDKALLALAAP